MLTTTASTTSTGTAVVHSGAATAGDAAKASSTTAGTATDVAAAGEAASAGTDRVQSCSSHSCSSSHSKHCIRIPAASVGSAATALAADSDDILLSYFIAAAPDTAEVAAAEQYNGSADDSTAVTAHYTLYAALIGQRLQQRLTGVHEGTAKDALWSCMRSVIESTVSAAFVTVNSVAVITDSSSASCNTCACEAQARQQLQCISSNSNDDSNSNSDNDSNSKNNSSSSSSSDCEWQSRLHHVVRLLLCTCTALKPLLGLGSRALVKLAALMFEGLRDCRLPDTGEATTAYACARLLVSTCRAYCELYC
jgi:hypothetical protein